MLRNPRQRQGAVPPAATTAAEMRPAAAQHVPGRVLVAVQLGAAHAAPVDPLRERLWNSGSRARRVLQRAGRRNFGEGNAGACSPAFQIVEELPPTRPSGGPVQASLVLALANHVADLRRLERNRIAALHNLVGEAMEFLPSRLRLPFMCPLKRRLLLAATPRTPPPRDTARCFRRSAPRTAAFR